ncbi:glycerol-3-phosphate dehydrogenase/oxidase [Nitrosomonas sp.]|uniref:glycerol-3-phosphate dehydrogenase/oxidase n=1 Tax=Nitrosomonas sp. TaxID=42353 RepID=UPI001D31557D|nr:glycerol-3-phosphate dehydrogenase/oxidase [Nitrosomonas sp.]MBX3616897.1 glycerol-3-phosphate dehydrogenase/oxidase [Nitrosomonas sp.]
MKRDFTSLSNKTYDLLICGGGIYGAWTAYDAALRGLKVLIVEQNDWAGATSSASTKLIHGGLRYLETFDFHLVKKSLKERTLLLRLAPHRVWPLHFGVPVYARQRINRLQLKLGLSLYDYLAHDTDPAMQHHYFNSARLSALFPFIKDNELKGGFTYADAQTDDARLVLELIAGAQNAGADCINYCQLIQILEIQGKADGAIVRDQLSDNELRIHAKQIVFTTGQWLAAAEPSQDWCRLAKGVHLVMPPLLKDIALLLMAPSDGRVFFMIPWYGLTLLGTTDTDYQGDVTNVTVANCDIDYLLEAANHYLKTSWTRSDIHGYFAGVRVFKKSSQSAASESPSAVSRDWELKSAPNGVHYAIGGKITSARQDAASIVDTICAQLGITTPCVTHNQLLPWAPRTGFSAWTTDMANTAVSLGIDAESTRWLLRRHGIRTTEIFQQIRVKKDLAQRIIPSLPFIRADLLYCAATEMIIHLDDLLRRRLPLLILTKLTGDQLRDIAQSVAAILNWDHSRQTEEIARCNRYRKQP